MSDLELSSFGDFLLGDWLVQPRLNRITQGDQVERLEPRCIDLLVFLARHPEDLHSRQRLIDEVWRVEAVAENTLTHAIAELRRALGDDARNPRYIETIHRRGYRLLVRPGGVSEEVSSISRTLSHYVLLEHLGGGGMGVVYRAEDTKLRREVALKFLPKAMSHDAEARKRFEREARAASALDHPHICTIHEIDETSDGQLFIAMAYYKGETLKKKIERGPLPVDEAIRICSEMAEALQRTHDAGIIHRDIKPANVMVTADGVTKIVDFGLAKLRHPTQDVETEAPTGTLETSPGTLIGTVAYMSPEQIRGQPADHRSDIFALGVVLFEMLSGNRPFSGATTTETAAAILKDTPASVTEINPALPRNLGEIVRRCLVKDPERRCQTAKALRNELEELKGEMDSGEILDGVVTRPPRAKWKKMLVAVGAAAAAVVATYFLLQPDRDASAPIQGSFTQLTTLAGEELFPSLSPDGEYLVYASEASGNWDVYLLRVGGENPLNLTEDSPEDDTQPAFSPDGKQIAFRSERKSGGIFLMGATGESVRRLTGIGYNPAWSPDGEKIVYAREESVATNPTGRFFVPNQLWAVNVSTGAEWLIAEGDAVQPSWSPHGSRIAYWDVGDTRNLEVAPNTQQVAGQRDIWTIPASGGMPLRVTNDPWLDWNPLWSHDGKHLYFSSNRGGTLNLWQVPIDEVSGEVLGEPEAVTTPSTWVGHMSTSRDGRRIVYTSRVSSKNLYKIAFDPVSESVVGQHIPVLEDSRDSYDADLSSDGRLLVVHLMGKQEDVAVIGTDGTGFRKLTDDAHRDRVPRWSPDGEQITFYSNRSGTYQIWSIHPDGNALRKLTESPDDIYYSNWSPDGTRVFSAMATTGGSPTKGFLWNPNKPWHEQKPEILPPFSTAAGGEQWLSAEFADWSPGGQTIAGTLGQSGEIALYDLDTQRHRVLTDFGSGSKVRAGKPRWLNDGRRLLFLFDPQGTLHLLNTETKEQKEILSLDRDSIHTVCLSKSNDFIYFVSGRSEADIWMLTLNEER